MKSNKQIFIGTFPLDRSNVELYALTDETNGYFYSRPDDTSPGRIKVGIATHHWELIVGILLHETMEMLMTKLRCRYEVSGVDGDHSSYTFMFNHCQFVDLCQSQADFVAPALPRLLAVWQKEMQRQKAKGTK